jgi:pyroglutamyl-peptidase
MYPQPQRQKPENSSKPKRTERQIKTCLITGFDSFGRNNFNPSERIASSLPESVETKSSRLLLHGEVLPTCCSEAWKKLRTMLMREQPNLLLLTGLAQKRHHLSIERFALNIRDYRIEDNSGHMYDGEPIVRNGPDAIKCRLPLTELRDHLWRKGFPTEISNTAGTYVCNDVYFRALLYQREHPSTRVLFVHIPLPDRYGKTLAEHGTKATKMLSGTKAQQLEAMRKGIIEIAKYCGSVAI